MFEMLANSHKCLVERLPNFILVNDPCSELPCWKIIFVTTKCHFNFLLDDIFSLHLLQIINWIYTLLRICVLKLVFFIKFWSNFKPHQTMDKIGCIKKNKSFLTQM